MIPQTTEQQSRIIRFSEVMEMMSGIEVFDLLSNPTELGKARLFCLVAWMRPKVVKGGSISEVMVEAEVVPSLSEARRKIKEGAVKWNGQKVIAFDMQVQFLRFGWGVIQIGKKHHTMVLSNPELLIQYELPPV